MGLKNELMNNDTQIIPVKGLPFITKWNLIWLKSKKLSLTAKAFFRIFKIRKRTIDK